MTSRLIVTSLADAAGSGLSSHGGSAQLTAKLARTTTRANGFTITTSIRRSGIALSSLAAAGRTRGSGRARTAGAFPSRLVYQPPRTSSSAITAGASSLFAFGRFGENRKMISQNNSQKPQLHQQFHTSTKLHGPVISLDTMNHNLRIMEYAVRGPIVIRAGEIERQLKEKPGSLPFKEVIRSNIGDCHATGQKPITYIRQVLATLMMPDQFLESDTFPTDVRAHAKEILSSCGGKSVGAYSDSAGVPVIKKHVAEFISKRDGVNTLPENIILQGGASEAIRSTLSMLNEPIDGKKPGVMIPIPQYPLYTATLAEFNMGQIPYFLDEDKNWALNITELERSLEEAKKNDLNPRAIVIINPGNPTGAVLSEQNVKDIIKFAHKHNLMLLADEVYQHNVYIGEFHSFRKVHHELGKPFNDIELISFMSCSKGYMGECGLRGGYMEVVNLDPEVKAVLLKSISAKLCSTVVGQATMDCIVNPPKEGSPSYDLFMKEKNAVLEQLRFRAKLVADTFNTFEGFKCNPVAGAMYAFPRITIPPKAIEKAKSLNQHPDFFYVKQLLEETGVCVVPGSGFGQLPGTFHFRTTILPSTQQLKDMLSLFKNFHEKFMKEYK